MLLLVCISAITFAPFSSQRRSHRHFHLLGLHGLRDAPLASSGLLHLLYAILEIGGILLAGVLLSGLLDAVYAILKYHLKYHGFERHGFEHR